MFTTLVNLTSLTCINDLLIGGVKTLTVIRVSDIISIPAVPCGGGYVTESVKVKTYAYIATYWFRRETVRYRSRQKTTNQGAYYEATIEGFRPLLDQAHQHELCKLKNGYYIAIITDNKDQVRIVGTKETPLLFTSDANTKKKKAEADGANWKFYGNQICQPLYIAAGTEPYDQEGFANLTVSPITGMKDVFIFNPFGSTNSIEAIQAATANVKFVFSWKDKYSLLPYYKASISPADNTDDAGNWTYISGLRTEAQFHSEVVAFFSESNFAFNFNKRNWAETIGYTNEAAKTLVITLEVEDNTVILPSSSSKEIPTVTIDALYTLVGYFSIRGKIMLLADAMTHSISLADIETAIIDVIAGDAPPTVTSGYTPTVGTDTGNNARFLNPNTISWDVYGAKVNGYHRAYGSDGNNEIFRISHNGGANVQESQNWTVERIGIMSSGSIIGRVFLDTTRRSNDEPILFFCGDDRTLSALVYNGSTWDTHTIYIDSDTNTINFDNILVDIHGNLVISTSNATNGVKLLYLYLSGSDYTDSNDWSVRTIYQDATYTNPIYALEIVGYESSIPSIIWGKSTETALQMSVYNGGVSGSSDDFTLSAWLTIAANPFSIVRYSDILLISTGSIIYKVSLSSRKIEVWSGSSTGYSNSIIV